MVRHGHRLLMAMGALALGAAAFAQDNQSEAIIGPPQLKDFSLQPRERIVPQAEPIVVPPPVTNRTAPAQQAPRPQSETQRNRPAERTAPPAAPAQRAPAPAETPAVEERPAAPATGTQPAPVFVPEAAPAEPAETLPEAIQAPAESGGGFAWYYALPAAALLALLGFAWHRRRRPASALLFDMEAASAARAEPAPAPVPAAPKPPPLPRPWLEISLKAERATFTDEEAEIQFELEILNTGGSEARNLRIDVKMFNAGAEQDKEIGAFFRKAGRQDSRLTLPKAAAGATGVIRGSVGMKREEIRAMQLDQRLLFVPVVAVNILYNYGENQMGQSSRSYLVGREAAQNERMGAFRVDLGPRVWRSVGQREHKLARRV